MLITEEIIDEAIAAAEEGHINGLTYSQSSWCGTACCVLGFARHIAGLPEKNEGPQDDEFVESPRIMAIRQLMNSPTPAILGIMRMVSAEGKINLRGAVLRGVNLTDAVLTGANLTGANLTRADLTRADLTRADLTRADLRDAVLTDAVLRGCDLTDAVLRGAVLRGAVLTRADLTDAVFTGANLTGADLTRASLRDVDLRGADLRGADLTGASRWEGLAYVPVTAEWLKKRGAIL